MIGWPTICFYVEANIDWLQILTGILQFTYVKFPRFFLFFVVLAFFDFSWMKIRKKLESCNFSSNCS